MGGHGRIGKPAEARWLLLSGAVALLLHKFHLHMEIASGVQWSWAGHLDPASAGGQPTSSDPSPTERAAPRVSFFMCSGRLCVIAAPGRWMSSRLGSVLLCIGRAPVETLTITLVSVRGATSRVPKPLDEPGTRHRLAAPQNRLTSPPYSVFAVGREKLTTAVEALQGTTEVPKADAPGPTATRRKPTGSTTEPRYKHSTTATTTPQVLH